MGVHFLTILTIQPCHSILLVSPWLVGDKTLPKNLQRFKIICNIESLLAFVRGVISAYIYVV